jgi:3'(2'), 5'-bisphosphate nucleotidase
MSTHVTNWLESVAGFAAEAGLHIMDVYATAFAVEKKDDASPLTAADTASHNILCERLQSLTPDIPVLSEESARVPFAERAQWKRFWLVDPLDGTKEFINRNGEFTVNIALIEGHEPILGVVHVPVTGVCYSAAQGYAMRQEPGTPPQRITTRPIAVNQPLRIVGSRSHGSAAVQAFAERLGEHTFVAVGSSLKFCLIAEGCADVYPRLGPTWEWDTAAAQCIVEQAGGQVVAIDGQRLRYNKESLLNPHFLVFGDSRRDWLSYLSQSSL